MKKLDGKFSIDGERIIKTSNGEAIPDDEPVFLLRARDHLAIALLNCYWIISAVDKCNDYHMKALGDTLREFDKFKAEHPERMKQPSITRGL